VVSSSVGLSSSGALWRLGLPLAIFAILWVDLVRQLSYMWSTSEQYAFGWFVPIFVLGLFWKRWMSRPAGQPSAPPFWLVALVAAAALAFLPLSIIHEINQDWSSCSYLLTAVVVAISLYAVYLLGGWPWVRYFAFPVCFILVAVNWPYRIDNSLKHRLMNAVTAATVEILGWLDVPAIRHGNVIELSTTSVGVEDACSGIRSLQSTVMAALFLGELYLLRLPLRFLLLALGIPLAFCLNIVRVLFLTWQASSSGAAVIAKWHDSAGMTIFMVCFGCLWIIALVLKRKGQGAEDRDPQPSTLNPQPSTPLPRAFMVAVGCWALLCMAATEGWYRAHDISPAQTVHWGVQFPTNYLSAHKTWMDPEVLQVLKCDRGDGYSWEEPDGGHWSAFFFGWRAGAATSRIAARDHRPEYCLPSKGFRIKADLGIHRLPAHGLELPFREYIFEEEGQVLYVFFCLWENGAETQTGLGNSKYLDRLQSALAGRRRLGQQTLEICVSGYAGMTEAEAAVRQRLPSLIQLGTAPESPAAPDLPGER